MTGPETAMDPLVGLALLVAGWLLLTSDNFLKAAVLFIAFGLFMSLAWVRLRAPDIALAEAAIGAGITGVLLMDAIRHMELKNAGRRERWFGSRIKTGRGVESYLPTALAIALGGALIAVAWHLPERRPGLASAVAAEMEPLEHGVTAVLLLFRSLDTWMELGVLLLAVLAMLAVRGRGGVSAVIMKPRIDPMLEGIVRVLTPLGMLCAVYLLWLGTHAAGGAFQAGVVLGALAILLWLSGRPSLVSLPEWLWKALITVGFGSFLLVSAVTALVGDWMLQYPDSLMPALIEGMEVAAAVSIGAAFAALFEGQHPAPQAFGDGHETPNEKERGRHA